MLVQNTVGKKAYGIFLTDENIGVYSYISDYRYLSRESPFTKGFPSLILIIAFIRALSFYSTDLSASIIFTSLSLLCITSVTRTEKTRVNTAAKR